MAFWTECDTMSRSQISIANKLQCIHITHTAYKLQLYATLFFLFSWFYFVNSVKFETVFIYRCAGRTSSQIALYFSTTTLQSDVDFAVFPIFISPLTSTLLHNSNALNGLAEWEILELINFESLDIYCVSANVSLCMCCAYAC